MTITGDSERSVRSRILGWATLAAHRRSSTSPCKPPIVGFEGRLYFLEVGEAFGIGDAARNA
jgi:hypothetical protein